MEDQTTDILFKAMATIASLFGIVNLLVIKPIRDRMMHVEERVDDTYSKLETEKQIELRQKPLESSLTQLNENITALNTSVQALSSNVRGMELLQQRMLGRERRQGYVDEDGEGA